MKSATAPRETFPAGSSRALVRGLRAGGATVVLTTHYMDEAERLCDRVAIMDHGKVIALGTPRELIRSRGFAIFSTAINFGAVAGPGARLYLNFRARDVYLLQSLRPPAERFLKVVEQGDWAGLFVCLRSESKPAQFADEFNLPPFQGVAAERGAAAGDEQRVGGQPAAFCQPCLQHVDGAAGQGGDPLLTALPCAADVRAGAQVGTTAVVLEAGENAGPTHPGQAGKAHLDYVPQFAALEQRQSTVSDEAAHGQAAKDLGAIEAPAPVRAAAHTEMACERAFTV